MNSRQLYDFLLQERCVYAGMIALLPVHVYTEFLDARKFSRTVGRIEKKDRKKREKNPGEAS